MTEFLAPCETLTPEALAAEALELLECLPLTAMAVLAGNRADVAVRLDEVLTRLTEVLPEDREGLEFAVHCLRVLFGRAGVLALQDVQPTLRRLAAEAST